jgi:hypothetical protein
MSESRTAILGLMPFALPEDLLPHGEGALELSVEELAELLPEGRAVLLGLRDGGWELDSASIEDGYGVLDDGRSTLDVCLDFTKEFSPPDVPAVVEDAQSCGVSLDWGNALILWKDSRAVSSDDDDDTETRWDITGACVG